MSEKHIEIFSDDDFLDTVVTCDNTPASEIHKEANLIGEPISNGDFMFNLVNIGTLDTGSSFHQACGNCPEHPRNGGSGNCLWDFVQFNPNGRLGATCEYLDELTGEHTECYGDDNWLPDLEDLKEQEKQLQLAIAKKGWFYKNAIKELKKEGKKSDNIV